MGTVIKTVPADLDVASRYSIRVRSVNSFGVSSPWSEALIVSTADFSAPATTKPTNVTVSSAPKAIVVRWTPVRDSDFAEYEIHVHTGAADFTPSASTLTGIVGQGNTFTVTQYWNGSSYVDLTPLGNYSVKMRAVSIARVFSDYTTYVSGVAGDSGTGGGAGTIQKELLYSMQDNLIAETGLARWYAPFSGAITSVRASVGTSPVGASVIVDVKKNGSSIFSSDKPTVPPGTYTDTATPTDNVITAGDFLTVDVLQVGSAIPGTDLTVQVIF